MLVASNTSPICNLAIIGRLSLLQAQFVEIQIPMAVKDELDRLSHADALKDIRCAWSDGWIKPQIVQDKAVVRLLETTIDRGEAEAIALSLEIAADLVLLDERVGRNAAERAGLRVTGVLGVLLRAKSLGQIRAVKPEIEALRARARFFVSHHIERTVLELARE